MEGKKRSAARIKAGVSITALAAAVAMFVILLQVEKSVLEQYEKGVVYVAGAPILKGQMITQENFALYFTEQELDVRCIPLTALKRPEQVQGLAAVFDVEEGVLLTQGMFRRLEDVLKDMEEPVVAGFRAEDMYQVVGGTLRAGDRVHIYSVQDGDAVLAWEEVYVQQVFDAAGGNIPNGDRTMTAQRINVYLDKKDVGAFYQELAKGGLRVVKIWE